MGAHGIEIKGIFLIPTSEKFLEFNLQIDSNLPPAVRIDEVRLRQILFNLVGNAIKFTDSGSINLSILVDRLDRKKNLADMRIVVEDTGIGIRGDQIDAIFESFRQQSGQSTRKYGGTGLGLSITKRLVELMGGSIEVRSELGKYSIFTINLFNIQYFDSDDAVFNYNIAQITNESNQYSFAKAKILVVDDMEINRQLVRNFFDDTEINVLEAENGRIAVDIATRNIPDIILMDIRMPEMDGFTATTILKNNPKTKHIPIIAVTASVIEKNKLQFTKFGFVSVIMKPVFKDKLFEELSKYLNLEEVSDGKSFVSANNDLIVNSGAKAEVVIDENVDISKCMEILDFLKNEMSVRWEEVFKNAIISEIKSFAESIIKIGEEVQINIFANYGAKLYNQASSFDFENFPETLSKFPEIVKEFEDLLNNFTKS